MRTVFVDTHYWVALTNPQDQWHQQVLKEYSLTDCISMLTMRRLGIYEVLTHDHHFAQEGFAVLL